MSEASGEQFARHLCGGTGRLLVLAGPEGLATPLRRRLFDAVRVLEVNRAVLFGDGTFLSQPGWVAHQASMDGVPVESCDHLSLMDTIVVLKTRVASFSKR